MNLNVSMVIQYRIWPETIDAGRHDSLENPPKGSFFKSQGRKGNSRPSTPPASFASSASVTEQATLTPGKVANLRSTYIQQIAFSLRNWSYYWGTLHETEGYITATNGPTKLSVTETIKEHTVRSCVDNFLLLHVTSMPYVFYAVFTTNRCKCMCYKYSGFGCCLIGTFVLLQKGLDLTEHFFNWV